MPFRAVDDPRHDARRTGEGPMISFAIAMLLQSAAAEAQTPTPAPPPPACQNEDRAAFDFWIGEWDVYPSGSEKKVADSRIERVAAGCVIRETWMPLRGGGGTSMSFLNPATGRWDQVWMGADGNRVDFTGGMVDGSMVISGYWPSGNSKSEAQLVRMTYTRQEDGSVRQFGQASTDHGVSWQTSFDFIYRRKQDATP
jgi:hypothetical protein